MATAQRYRCMDDDCVWTGTTPHEEWLSDGIHFLTLCPLCDECAELVDPNTAPPQGKAGLN